MRAWLKSFWARPSNTDVTDADAFEIIFARDVDRAAMIEATEGLIRECQALLAALRAENPQ